MVYNTLFCGKDHGNFVGMNHHHGPIVITILNETVDAEKGVVPVLIRTVKADKKVYVPNINPSSRTKYRDVTKVLKEHHPDLLDKIKLFERFGNDIQKDLINFEKGHVIKQLKFGVMYCKEGQTNDEQMLNNSTTEKTRVTCCRGCITCNGGVPHIAWGSRRTERIHWLQWWIGHQTYVNPILT